MSASSSVLARSGVQTANTPIRDMASTSRPKKKVQLLHWRM
jgi:hypothetical protein